MIVQEKGRSRDEKRVDVKFGAPLFSLIYIILITLLGKISGNLKTAVQRVFSSDLTTKKV